MNILQKRKFVTRKAYLITTILQSRFPAPSPTASVVELEMADEDMRDVLHDFSTHPTRKFKDDIKKINDQLVGEFGVLTL